ncbi:hypothetical protein HAX54_035221 [Datura stramonium]|uniref:tRNA synthetases class I catalytic domain-containing protein n=1 Tax=Datura stramonium TaxID=4076 RepID=A0ABS8SFA4_DATST|nr:hypothetical protein [Datura stramonium]
MISTHGSCPCLCRFDILYRYLKYLLQCCVCSKFCCDIDDKVIKRAKESEVDDPIALSARFSQEFLKDMHDLQCLLPTIQPRVTEHMEQINDIIGKIMTTAAGTKLAGDVYFSVDSFPEHGRGLSAGRKLENSIAGKRVEVDWRKRNPADFALWKAAKPGEPSWDSPSGPGRPVEVVQELKERALKRAELTEEDICTQ